MGQSAKAFDFIINSYTDELSLFRQLLIVTESIKGLAQNAQIDQTERKIQKRKDIITQIKSIEEGLLPYRKRWGSLWEEMPPQARNKAQSLVNGIRENIERIQALDKETRALLSDDKEKVAGMLEKASRGHTLIKRYTPFRMGKPRYLSQAA